MLLKLTLGGEIRMGRDEGKGEHRKTRGRFSRSQTCFYRSESVVAVDEGHSREEPRLFCIGHTGRGVLTVRFVYRSRESIRIIGAGYWRKGKKLYEKANRQIYER